MVRPSHPRLKKLSQLVPQKITVDVADSTREEYPSDTVSTATGSTPNFVGSKVGGTSAEKTPEYPDQHPEKTPAAFVESFLSGHVPITHKSILLLVFVGWLVVVAWLFLQDNGAGRLNGPDGFTVYWRKFKYAACFGLVVEVAIMLFAVLKKAFSSLSLWLKSQLARRGR